MLEKGVVTFFDSRDNKRYGFIALRSGEEIFFHFNDGRDLRVEEDRLKWYLPSGKSLADPKPGDVVVFQVEKGRKGLKAAPWTYERNYFREAKKLRPPHPLYRVREVRVFSGSTECAPRTLWEGKNVFDLKLKTIFPLRNPHSSPQGDCDVRRWFEVHVQGQWIECSDPRRR